MLSMLIRILFSKMNAILSFQLRHNVCIFSQFSDILNSDYYYITSIIIIIQLQTLQGSWLHDITSRYTVGVGHWQCLRKTNVHKRMSNIDSASINGTMLWRTDKKKEKVVMHADTAVNHARSKMSRASTSNNNRGGKWLITAKSHRPDFSKSSTTQFFYPLFNRHSKKPNQLILHRLTGMLIRRLLLFFGIFFELCLLDSITVLPIFYRSQRLNGELTN